MSYELTAFSFVPVCAFAPLCLFVVDRPGKINAGGDTDMDLSTMMKQAQRIQEQIAKIQEELGDRTVDATAGAGMVTVTANGKQEILSIKISPDAMESYDATMIEDLITAAVNEALRSSKALLQSELSKITGGIRIPGINM